MIPHETFAYFCFKVYTNFSLGQKAEIICKGHMSQNSQLLEFKNHLRLQGKKKKGNLYNVDNCVFVDKQITMRLNFWYSYITSDFPNCLRAFLHE